MTKSIRVQLFFIYGRIQKLLQFGKEHRIMTSSGAVKKSSVAKNIVDEVLDIRFDPVFGKIIEDEGINMLDMNRKLWMEYAERHGYLKKKGN